MVSIKERPLIWNLSKRVQSALKNFTINEESSEAEELSSMETMALLNSDPTEALEFISDAIDDRSTGGTEAGCTEGKSSEAVGFVFLSGIFGLEGEFTASINGSETVIAPEANAGEGEAITQKNRYIRQCNVALSNFSFYREYIMLRHFSFQLMSYDSMENLSN